MSWVFCNNTLLYYENHTKNLAFMSLLLAGGIPSNAGPNSTGCEPDIASGNGSMILINLMVEMDLCMLCETWTVP